MFRRAAQLLQLNSSCVSLPHPHQTTTPSSILLRRLDGGANRKAHSPSNSTAQPFAPFFPHSTSPRWGSCFPISCISPLSSTNPLVFRQRSIRSLGFFSSSHSSQQTWTSHPKPRLPKRKALPHRQPSYQPRSLQSSISSWTAAILVCTLAFIYSFSTSEELVPKPKQRSAATHKLLDEIEEEISKMTGESLPGRPGTLTPEQDEKLREFWVATLQVFGVLDAKDVEGDAIAELPNGRGKTDGAAAKKQKKKRLGLFRKQKEADTESTTSSESRTPTGLSEDDKYGQTKEFHDALASQSPELLRATFWSMVKHDHPDALLLRFLRARKWDIDKAMVMMISTMKWRATDVRVDDDIMKNGELGALEDLNSSNPAKQTLAFGFIDQMRMGKSFLHGVDKAGRPMCYVRARLHKQGEQSPESLERYTIFIIESARMVLSPPVDTACVVFDMTGFSLANMDYTPVKFMIKCFEANYPESLGVVLIHKAPWIFQGIWKIVKAWLDPVVASKVNFTNSNEEMAEFVPESHVIKELGGHEDWEYKYIEPVPGEDDKMKDTTTRDKLLQEREHIVKDYENSTLDWVHGVGDVEKTKAKRHELAVALREDYWRLDPYIRARSFYDRSGMIQPGGKIDFYPDTTLKAPTPAPSTNGVNHTDTSPNDVD